MNNSIVSQNPQNPQSMFQFDFHGHPLRGMVIDRKPYFVALDICKALDLRNVTKALYGLKQDEIRLTVGKPYGGTDEMNLVTDSGLYRLVFRSNKDEAEEFRLWVFSEVLPQIMYTGNYINPNADPLDVAEQMIASIRQQNQRIAMIEWQQGNIDTRVTKLEKKPIKGYHVIADYVFAKKRLETPEKIAIMEQAALKLSAELRYDVHQLDGDRLAFHEEIIKRVMG